MTTVRGLVAVAAAAILVSGSIAEAQAPFVIPDSTPVRLRLNRNLSSAQAREGDTVDFELLEDLKINDVVVASRGSVALATITQAKARGRMGKSGKLDVNIDHLRLINGEKIALRAIRESEGGGNTGKMTGAMVATSIIFFPAAPLFLFMKGKDVTIPKGTEITSYVNGDIKLDPNKFMVQAAAPQQPAHQPQQQPAQQPQQQAYQPPQQPRQPAPQQSHEPAPAPVAQRASKGSKAMTNEDIIALKGASFSDELIISKIRSTPGNYRTDTSDLLELKRNKVSDAVIGAMLEKK